MERSVRRWEIRPYRSGDVAEMARLFYDTVHTVNARDYSAEQLDAWATGEVDLAAWDRSFLVHTTLVARDGERIVGFGDISEAGYLDRLYVHVRYQGQGIGTALCDKLEEVVPGTIVTEASITARPFFEARGYRVVREQVVHRKGVGMTNYRMEKKR